MKFFKLKEMIPDGNLDLLKRMTRTRNGKYE